MIVSVFNPGILIIGAVIDSVEVELMIVCVYRLFRFLYREVSLKIEKLCRETIKLSRYVNAIDYGMGEFAKGNLTARSSVTFIGDFASIQKSIVVFAEKVKDVIGSVEESSQIVAESSEQISGASQDLAESATNQAQSVSMLLEENEQVVEMIQSTAKGMQGIHELTDTAGRRVLEEKQKMAEVLASMEEIIAITRDIIHNVETVFAGTRMETEAIARIREGVNDISNMVLTSSAASQANKRYGFFPIFGFCHLL